MNIFVNTKINQGNAARPIAVHVRHKQEKRDRMINLLQENIEMKSQRTIAHLVFADPQKSRPEKTKRAIFANAK